MYCFEQRKATQAAVLPMFFQTATQAALYIHIRTTCNINMPSALLPSSLPAITDELLLVLTWVWSTRIQATSEPLPRYG
jgi:hypothetical protein